MQVISTNTVISTLCGFIRVYFFIQKGFTAQVLKVCKTPVVVADTAINKDLPPCTIHY